MAKSPFDSQKTSVIMRAARAGKTYAIYTEKGISSMAVKYHCRKCGKRFIDWGAEKLGFKCPDCENEQVVFSHATRVVNCNVCGATLAKATGGKAELKGEITAELE